MTSYPKVHGSKVSDKKPADLVSRYNIVIINRTLSDVRHAEERSSLALLDLLSEDEMSKYSDVLLLLAQFKQRLTVFETAFMEMRRMTPTT
ncbi:MAG: hypothetical protein ACR2MC_03620 [Actinomycetota bacterium]